MTTAAELPPRPLTLDDVTRLAEADSEHRFELTEGNLIVMPPGTWRHQQVGVRLAMWLASGRYRSEVNLAPGVRTGPDELNGRIPDLVVTIAPIAPDRVWLDPEEVALAIEIVSKGSERMDRWTKPMEYAAAGIPRFWRVESDDTVVQFELDGERYRQVREVALADLIDEDVPDLS